MLSNVMICPNVSVLLNKGSQSFIKYRSSEINEHYHIIKGQQRHKFILKSSIPQKNQCIFIDTLTLGGHRFWAGGRLVHLCHIPLL